MTTKTVPCKFFQKGYCRNGNTCDYSHGLNLPAQAQSRYEQPTGLPPSTPKTAHTIGNKQSPARDIAHFRESCHFFREGRCMKGDKCPRRHEIPESSNLTTDVCHFFLKGKCIFGDKCRRSHPIDTIHTQIKPTPENGAIATHTFSVYTLRPLN